MRIITFLSLVIILVSCKVQTAQGLKTQNVLFIGNSLTYFFDMPQTLQQMLNETHPNIKVDQITFPGIQLYNHVFDNLNSTTSTELKIKEKNWDVIILQTGTVRVLIPEIRDLKVNKAISKIKALNTNANCKFILFNTWPAKVKYPKQYCYGSEECSPVLENLEEHLKAINDAYTLLAAKNDLIKSNNGTKFYNVLTKHPDINLYDDAYHPNKYGAFLNACVFYQMLTGKKAINLKYSGDMEPNTNVLLKEVTKYLDID